MHIYVNTLKCIEMTSKKKNFILHKIFLMKGAKNSLKGGWGWYNLEWPSAVHLHPLLHFWVIHFPHPIIMDHPHPHFLGCPSPPLTIPEPLYLQSLRKIYTSHPHSRANMSTTIPKIIRKIGKINDQCFCAHRALIFWKK